MMLTAERIYSTLQQKCSGVFDFAPDTYIHDEILQPQENPLQSKMYRGIADPLSLLSTVGSKRGMGIKRDRRVTVWSVHKSHLSTRDHAAPCDTHDYGAR